MKNGGDLFVEGQRMMAVSRFNEAAARFYLASTVEPGFLPAQFLMGSAQFLRDCAIQGCSNDGFNFLPDKLSQWQKESITKIVRGSFGVDDASSPDDLYAGQCKAAQTEDSKLHVVTVAANGQGEQVQTLKDSATAHGISIDVLGAGVNYVNSGTRLLLLSEYLTDMPEDDIVMFVGKNALLY